MNIMVGVIDVRGPGDPKAYAREKNRAMLAKIAEREDVDVFIQDETNLPPEKLTWCDEITYEARESLRQHFLDGDWGALVFIGMDCFFASSRDWYLFVVGAIGTGHDVVGALTVGRTRPDYPIARRLNGGVQQDVPHHELQGYDKRYVRCTYPSTDNVFVSRRALEAVPVADPDYVMWYKRGVQHTEGTSVLATDENWCANMERAGMSIVVDTHVTTYHVSEDGMAHRFEHPSVSLEALPW